MRHVVHKTFTGGGDERGHGEVVDTSSWPDHRITQLEDQRFLEPLHGPIEPIVCRCGRTWVDEEAMRAEGHEFEQGREALYDELKVLTRSELLDRAEDKGLSEDEIEGTGSQGYVKRADIINAILEHEE